MTIVVLPEWEACLYQWVTAQTEFSDQWGDRLYRELPNTKVYPLGQVRQIGDPNIVPGAHGIVRALFQFDFWGDDGHATWQIAETTRALLETRLTGTHDVPAGPFVAGHVVCGGIARTREPVASQAVEGTDTAETSRRRPHCRFDARAVLRAPQTAGS
jgi:hypothetical protein